MTLLHQSLIQLTPKQQHNLRHRRRIFLAAQHAPGPTARLLIPKPHDMEQIVSDVSPIVALKGGLVAVEHGLEDGEHGLEGDVDLGQDVDDPGFRADAVLELERVPLEHGEEVFDGE